MNPLLFLTLCLLWLASPISQAADKFLPADQAFIIQSVQQDGQLHVSWHIAEGYYLYEKRTHAFYSSNDQDIDLPMAFTEKSELKMDRNFGEVPVFFHNANAGIDVTSIPATTVWIEYQGCAKNGLCYQPQLHEVLLTPIATDSQASMATETRTSALSDLTSTDSINRFLASASLLSTIAIFFALGVGLSLTPCILPMVPILSGIIVGQGEKLTTRHGIALSSAYVLGMSVSYALAGMLAASFGAKGNLQLYMQNPWVISAFSLVFVALALSMFGLYTLSLPGRLQNALYQLSSKQQGGQLTGVFIMGALSALVVSPCVSAPLAGALVFISSTGNQLLGGSALFALGIGMGLPLIAIGAGGGRLVPKAGAWMNQVKIFFGVVLLAVALWLLSRIIPGHITLLLAGLLLMVYAIHSGALEPASGHLPRLRKAAGFILLLYGTLLFIGGIGGASHATAPLAFMQTSAATSVQNDSHALFRRISTREQLQQALSNAATSNQPVMLDIYADWCTACIDMERNVFSQLAVQQGLAGFTVLQLDITNNTAEQKHIMDQLNLFGPPSVLFFNAQGQELVNQRVQGELSSADFVQHLNQVMLDTRF